MAVAVVAPPEVRERPDVVTPPRLRSLDVVRGAAIVGMILVNNQGSGAHAFWSLSHAKWNGWTAADLVFPLFLFAVGGSLAMVTARRRVSTRKIVTRAAALFAIGLALNFFPWSPLSTLGIMGVLQRIALAYAGAAFLIRLEPRRQVVVGAALLAGYWAAVSALPMRPDHSLPGLIDVAVLGRGHVYLQGNYDPQGLLATLPSIVSVLAGYWAVRWLRPRQGDARVTPRLAAAGLACVAVGLLWGVWFPINKRMWTSSYVVLAAGFAVVALAAAHHAVDVRGGRRLTDRLAVLGSNALLLFVGSEMLTTVLVRTDLRPWLYRTFAVPAFGFRVGSLAYGVAICLVWYAVAQRLWRRGWFVRV
jgi:predicted acyltransferase